MSQSPPLGLSSIPIPTTHSPFGCIPRCLFSGCCSSGVIEWFKKFFEMAVWASLVGGRMTVGTGWLQQSFATQQRNFSMFGKWHPSLSRTRSIRTYLSPSGVNQWFKKFFQMGVWASLVGGCMTAGAAWLRQSFATQQWFFKREKALYPAFVLRVVKFAVDILYLFKFRDPPLRNNSPWKIVHVYFPAFRKHFLPWIIFHV